MHSVALFSRCHGRREVGFGKIECFLKGSRGGTSCCSDDFTPKNGSVTNQRTGREGEFSSTSTHTQLKTRTLANPNIYEMCKSRASLKITRWQKLQPVKTTTAVETRVRRIPDDSSASQKDILLVCNWGSRAARLISCFPQHFLCDIIRMKPRPYVCSRPVKSEGAG